MRRSSFWRLLMTAVALGWLVILGGLAATVAGASFMAVPAIRTVWLVFCAVWATHLFEIPLASWEIGKRAGLPGGLVIAKTLAFGFTWWLGLKRGELDR